MGATSVKLKAEKFDEAAAAIIAKAEGILKANAFAIEAGAKMRAPVDTGFLRNSIQTRFPVPGTAIISAAAEYAIYVEMGTRFAAPQPFLIPAYDSQVPKYLAALKNLGRGLRF